MVSASKLEQGLLVKFVFVFISLVLINRVYSAELISNEILVKFKSEANKQIIGSMPYGQLQISGQSLGSNNVLGRLNAKAKIVSVEPVYKQFYKNLQTEISKGKSIDQILNGLTVTDLSPYYKVNLDASVSVEDAIDAYKANPDVAVVETTNSYQASLVPSWTLGSDADNLLANKPATIVTNLLPEGLYKLTLNSSNDLSTSSSQEITVNVRNDYGDVILSGNQTPYFVTFPGSVGVIKGKAYTWSFMAKDPEGVSIALLKPTTSDLPAGATIGFISHSAGTGTITLKWTPPMSYKKTTVVIPFIISDGALSTTRNMSITVR